MHEQRDANRGQVRQFERLCLDRGMPLTVQRRTVLEAVLGRYDHPTADQVYEEVQGLIPGVSRTTVYRVLDLLVRFGIITRVCHPGATARFDGNTGQHHHLVCLQCDTVVDLEDEALDALDLPDTRQLGFEVTDFRVQLRGICADCRKKAATSKRKPASRRTGRAPGFKNRKRKTQPPKQRRKAQ